MGWLGRVCAVAALTFGLGGIACAADISIGVLQYNVKQGKYKHQNGWDPGLGSLQKEVAQIVDKVKDASNPAPVQFISLVQAYDHPISDYLPKGWGTVRGGCKGNGYTEGVQIGYSPEWTLVKRAGNPLSDDFDSNNCFSSGRPYNLAYFENVAAPKFKLLVVVVHPGHCHGGYYSNPDAQKLEDCIAHQHLIDDFGQFGAQALAATGASSSADLKDINVMIVGDTNELGTPGPNLPPCGPFKGTPAGYERIFPNFGPFAVATLEIAKSQCSTSQDDENGTCCSDSDFYYAYDRVVINHPVRSAPPVESIIDKPNYPLFGGSEEHKAIYGVVTFAAP